MMFAGKLHTGNKKFSRLALFSALILAVIAIAAPSFAQGGDRHAELMKNEDYREAYEQYTAKMSEAEKRLPAADYERLKAENAEAVSEMLEGMGEGEDIAEAYAMAYSGQLAYIDNVLRWDYLKKNPDGVQGFYLLQSEIFDGILTVEEGDEEGMFAVTLSVTMKKEPYNSGDLDGFGILEGNKMNAHDKGDEDAVVTLAFDGDEAKLGTSDEFKKSGFAGAGVLFDGTYIRQKAGK